MGIGDNDNAEDWFTLGEACRELGITRPILRKWMRDKMRPPIEARAHEWDARFQLITRADLERIRATRAKMPTTTPRGPRRDLVTGHPPVSMPSSPPVATRQPAPRATTPLGRLIRQPLPAGYISVSRYLNHHSVDPDHPLQSKVLQRFERENPALASLSPPPGVDWRSDRSQRVQHAYTWETHVAVSRVAVREWPTQFKPCDICRAAVEAELATSAIDETLAEVAGAIEHEE